MMCDDIRLFLLVIIILATDVNHRSLSLNLTINKTVAWLIPTLILPVFQSFFLISYLEFCCLYWLILSKSLCLLVENVFINDTAHPSPPRFFSIYRFLEVYTLVQYFGQPIRWQHSILWNGQKMLIANKKIQCTYSKNKINLFI